MPPLPFSGTVGAIRNAVPARSRDVRHEGFGIATHEAVRLRKTGRALRRIEDVRAVFEHGPRNRNGIPERWQRADSARPQAPAVHDGGIELDTADFVQAGAGPRVEAWVVLQRAHRAFDGIEGVTPVAKPFGGFLDRGETSLTMPLGALGWEVPRAAVNEDRP